MSTRMSPAPARSGWKRRFLIELLFTQAHAIAWRPVPGIHPDDVRAAWGGWCVAICSSAPSEVQ